MIDISEIKLGRLYGNNKKIITALFEPVDVYSDYGIYLFKHNVTRIGFIYRPIVKQLYVDMRFKPKDFEFFPDVILQMQYKPKLFNIRTDVSNVKYLGYGYLKDYIDGFE